MVMKGLKTVNGFCGTKYLEPSWFRDHCDHNTVFKKEEMAVSSLFI